MLVKHVVHFFCLPNLDISSNYGSNYISFGVFSEVQIYKSAPLSVSGLK